MYSVRVACTSGSDNFEGDVLYRRIELGLLYMFT